MKLWLLVIFDYKGLAYQVKLQLRNVCAASTHKETSLLFDDLLCFAENIQAQMLIPREIFQDCCGTVLSNPSELITTKPV